MLSIVIFILSILLSGEVQGDDTLELGAGVFTFQAPHYRGSDQEKNYVFPFPHLEYKSKKIEAESSFVRAIFYDSKYFTTKLSMNAGLRVESHENTARQGMPELNWTVELGPTFIFHLIRNRRFQWQIELLTRRVFDTDFSSIKGVGILSGVYFNFILKSKKRQSWLIEIYTGLLYGDKDLNNYYYGVGNQFATSERQAFNASSGYLGTSLVGFYRLRLDDFIIMPFIRYDELSNTKVLDSPLVRQKSYLLAGLGLFYVFF